MSFIEFMQNRYTTKEYDSSQQLDSQTIDNLKEILRLSPSSINSQPWQFTFISDKVVKNKLSEVSFHNKERIQHCDSVVVFSRVNDIAFFEENLLATLPETAQAYYQQFLKPLDETVIKAWFDRQVYIALGVFLSACASMGVDATPMEGISPADYDNILTQKDYATVVAVAIGLRHKDDFNQPSKKAKSRRTAASVIRTI